MDMYQIQKNSFTLARQANEVRTKVINKTGSKTLQRFIADNADKKARVCPDRATAYDSLPFDHEAVNLQTTC